MQKTRKAVAKRFKVTGTGKIMRRTPGRRHMMTAKSTRQLKTGGKDKQVAAGFVNAILANMPTVR
jgi:large subunit ribosomal protein L35